ncbi:MAG: preprotein translocase subunit YajC [Bacteroidales bacterium]|nr:preprotein translocase subunit YajC [Bacteroidales bacterium]MCF8328459.1 preprotein translocase subunit YajC [Bacteroidales bacterium]
MQLLNVILQSGFGGEGGLQSLIFLALIIVVFWLFFIRPQTKKNKELKKFRENLEKGQKIVTIGGIHGKVVSVDDNTVTIEVEDQNRLKMDKAAISNEYKEEAGVSQRQ